MTNRYSTTVVTEIILDVSGRSNDEIFDALKKLKEATEGIVVWRESGVPLDGLELSGRISRLIYNVNDESIAFEYKAGYTTPNETLYKRIPSWISAIVKQRSK